MSDIEDIKYALSSGLSAAESLLTWQSGAEAHDEVKRKITYIKIGITAANKLSSELREGRKHIEPPDDYVSEGCACSTSKHPPCGWCESGKGDEQP